jgi:hypothetical protein
MTSLPANFDRAPRYAPALFAKPKKYPSRQERTPVWRWLQKNGRRSVSTVTQMVRLEEYLRTKQMELVIAFVTIIALAAIFAVVSWIDAR